MIASELWLFFGLVFGVVVLPGLDMGFVLASALVGGARSGLAAVAGLVLGGFAHVAAATTGVAVLLQTSPLAFHALLIAGSLYLAWVGFSIFRSQVALTLPTGTAASTSATLRRGVVTCLLNPKAYLFTLAVFPRFLHVGTTPLWVQGVTLSAIIAATQVTVYGAVALGAARLRHVTSGPWLARAVGALLMLTAGLTLFAAARR